VHDSHKQFIFGVVLILVGFGLIAYRKAIRRRVDDNWNARVAWPLQSHGFQGKSFEVSIVIFAAFLLLVGLIYLIQPFVQQWK